MKIVQKFQALKPALMRLRHEMTNQKGKLHIVFDIDDTIIFDNARSTPNLQVVEFLKEFKKQGHSIHLVTARSTEARQDTLLELNRVGMPFDTLDLCPEKMREDLSKVSKFKYQMRKKQAPVAASLGDQWTDFVQIAQEEDLDHLDLTHGTEEQPWILVDPEDGITAFGLKLMAS